MCIQSHLESNSELAANRLVNVGKDVNNQNIRKPVRYRDTTLFETYNNFEFKNELVFSTFCKYIGTEYKTPHSPFDLCDW